MMPSMLGRFPVSVPDNIETEWAMGFFFAVRRSLVIRWNLLFDEKLTGYAYAEDLDFTYTYSKKAKSEGMHCIFNPHVIVNHLGSKEHRIPSETTIFMYVINRKYLSYKHNKRLVSRLATRWANFGMVLMNLNNIKIAKLYLKAQVRCDHDRKKLRCGIIPDSAYKS